MNRWIAAVLASAGQVSQKFSTAGLKIPFSNERHAADEMKKVPDTYLPLIDQLPITVPYQLLLSIFSRGLALAPNDP